MTDTIPVPKSEYFLFWTPRQQFQATTRPRKSRSVVVPAYSAEGAFQEHIDAEVKRLGLYPSWPKMVVKPVGGADSDTYELASHTGRGACPACGRWWSVKLLSGGAAVRVCTTDHNELPAGVEAIPPCAHCDGKTD